jgi:lipopolysaccharide export system permease protein
LPKEADVFWGIIHRMILMELIKIFSMALVALTGIILVAGIISEAMKNGFGPAQILAIIPLLLPSLLPYTVPTTTLFATCIVYGRLSADNEILALKAAGTHIVHVIWPAVLLGIVTGVVTMIFYIDVIPYTGYLLRNRVVSDVEELLYMMLRRDGHIKHPRLDVEIHVNNVSGRKLQEAIFKRRSADGNGYDVIAYAKEAELRVDTAHKQILIDMRQCNIVQRDGGVGYVESKIWPVDLPPDFIGSSIKFRAMDMLWAELFEYYEKHQRNRLDFEQQIELLRAKNNLNPGAADGDLMRRLQDERRYAMEQMYSIEAEWQMRPALALSCLCFALVACPIGIWFSKSDYLSAFITCFLPIVTVYYPLMFCMYDMSRAGKISPPYLGIYNADILMLITGLILFRRLARN